MRPTKESLKWRLFWNNCGSLIVSFVLLVISSGLVIIPGIIVQEIIDNKGKGADFLLALYLAVIFFIYLTGIIQGWFIEKFGQRTINWIRYNLLKNILNYDQMFFNKNSVGTILEYYSQDLSTILSFITSTMPLIMLNLFTLIGILGVCYFKNILMGIFFTIFVVVALWIIYRVQKTKDNNILELDREKSVASTAFYDEIFNLKKEINILGKSSNIASKLDSDYIDWKPVRISAQKYLYRIWITALLLLSIGNAISLLLGGGLFKLQMISLGEIYLLYNYSNLLKGPIEYLQVNIQSLKTYLVSIKRLDDIFFYKPSVVSGVEELPNSKIGIEISGLTHRFNDKEVLHDIHLKLESGKRLGIFGDSGSGKSTLCKILCKLIPLQNGSIKINGIDINLLSTETIRKNILLLSSSSKIFDASLLDNLTFYQNGLNSEAKKILNQFDLTDIFRQKLGQDYLVTPIKNEDLSEGEKQLINILRAFFIKKNLVIFDEASSRIDEKIEKLFFKILDKIFVSNSSIIITHRVERLNNCHQIAYFKDGYLLEYGDRERLLTQDSYYAKHLRRISE